VAAIHVAGVRGDRCGAVRCSALHHNGHHVHLLNVLLPQQELIVGILNSVFF